jgi:hypothetical protein
VPEAWARLPAKVVLPEQLMPITTVGAIAVFINSASVILDDNDT